MVGVSPEAVRHVGCLLPWPQTNLAAHSGQGCPLFTVVEGPLYFGYDTLKTVTD